MTVALPDFKEAEELVATFTFRPGWKAKVDGKAREIYCKDDRLIRLAVHPGEREAVIKFEPYRWYHFAASILASFALFIGGCALLNHTRRVRLQPS